MRFLRSPACPATLLLTLLAACGTATTPPSGPVPANLTDVRPVAEESDYATIVDAETESDDGLFTVHRKDGDVYFEATGNVTWMKSYDADSNVTHSVFQRAGILYGEEDEVEAFKTIVFREGRLWSWGTLALGTGSVIQGEKGDNTIWTLFAAELAAHPIDTKLRCGIGAERIMKAGQDDTFLYVRIDFKP